MSVPPVPDAFDAGQYAGGVPTTATACRAVGAPRQRPRATPPALDASRHRLPGPRRSRHARHRTRREAARTPLAGPAAGHVRVHRAVRRAQAEPPPRRRCHDRAGHRERSRHGGRAHARWDPARSSSCRPSSATAPSAGPPPADCSSAPNAPRRARGAARRPRREAVVCHASANPDGRVAAPARRLVSNFVNGIKSLPLCLVDQKRNLPQTSGHPMTQRQSASHERAMLRAVVI